MAAVGGRGVLSKAMGGLELAIRSDVRATATMSDSSTAPMGDSGSTSRVRLLLDGTRSRALESGAVLGLTLEAGLEFARRLALPGDKPENALMLQGSMRW